MMKPFDEMEAKLTEKLRQINQRPIDRPLIDDASGDYRDEVYELVIGIAEAIDQHYLNLPVHSGNNGTKTGKLDALEMLCLCLSICNTVDIAPPEPLVAALYTCTGITERWQRDWEAQRKHYGPIITLFDYRKTNPMASQNQAAKDTGMPRSTVHRIENSAEWKKFVGDPNQLWQIRLQYRKNQGPIQTVVSYPPYYKKDLADIFDEIE